VQPRAPQRQWLAFLTVPSIDLLVNAAVRYEMGPIMNAYTADYFESQFKWNVILPMRLSVLVAERFWRDRDIENRKNNRNVVNMSSTAGVHLYENAGQGPYAASKAALNHATRHLASEFSTIGIRANALAPESFPGIISTESVVEAIARLDQSVGTGQVVVLDTHGKRTV
jgi:NAD(P)-dependent dehydrogenase (short-subunit alcohol dehydrogenase family)